MQICTSEYVKARWISLKLFRITWINRWQWNHQRRYADLKSQIGEHSDKWTKQSFIWDKTLFFNQRKQNTKKSLNY